MTIEDLIVYGKKYLSSTETKLLISQVTNYDTLNLLNHLNEPQDQKTVELFKQLVEARKNNKPLQYILGSTNFYGLNLVVNENVLIPRFETEELVENTIKIIKNKFNKPIKILDLCTGSGAIGLKLKEIFKDSKVTLSDISPKALKVAKQNSENLELNVEIIESDLFENINDKFDCIISNPPYIKDDEEIESIVKENEPAIALYGGKDGLDYYEKILKDISKYLNDKFIIAFEIGYTQKEDVIKIANKYLENVVITCKKDMSLKDRMIFIEKK